jgi:hypothetical protein
MPAVAMSIGCFPARSFLPWCAGVEEADGMLGGAEENCLHQGWPTEGSQEPLGHDGTGPDEELGTRSGEGGWPLRPQSARSPGAGVRCDSVRCMRGC